MIALWHLIRIGTILKRTERTASGPEIYVGNKGNQRTRDAQAYYGQCYAKAIEKLREKNFRPSERGVPIEYFQWERVVIDECHE